jgi:hypothetical protein
MDVFSEANTFLGSAERYETVLVAAHRTQLRASTESGISAWPEPDDTVEINEQCLVAFGRTDSAEDLNDWPQLTPANNVAAVPLKGRH